MAMFALNMTAMALELAQELAEYEDMAIQCYRQFLAIANSIAGHTANTLSLWDRVDGFFKDLLITPDGESHRIDVYSYVGLIPLFATEIVEPEILEKVPRFKALLDEHKGGMFDGHTICACPIHTNEHGERLLALVDHTMIRQILRRLLDENEFLSGHGIRSLSRTHAEKHPLRDLPGVGAAFIEYEPGESQSPLFGGNSNWRGPVWIPINYSILQALTKFHRFLGPGFTVEAPGMADGKLNLQQVADFIAERLINLFRREEGGLIPLCPGKTLSGMIHTGGSCGCSMNISTAGPAWVSALRIRQAGLLWWPISLSDAIHWLPKRKGSKGETETHPSIPAMPKENSRRRRPSFMQFGSAVPYPPCLTCFATGSYSCINGNS
jgi:hypothetical protein